MIQTRRALGHRSIPRPGLCPASAFAGAETLQAMFGFDAFKAGLFPDYPAGSDALHFLQGA
jgi:hypothetical protein